MVLAVICPRHGEVAVCDKMASLRRTSGTEDHGAPAGGQVQHHAPRNTTADVDAAMEWLAGCRRAGVEVSVSTGSKVPRPGDEESSGGAPMAGSMRCGGRMWRQIP
jgi:hypothetical protein